MIELSISGVDFCNLPQLESELVAEIASDLILVTYEPASLTVTIRLNRNEMDGDYERNLRRIVTEHNGVLALLKEAADVALQAEVSDVNARFALSVLSNKTPQQIYTAVQNQVDSWGTLAQARAGLRELLPLLAAILAVKVQKRDN